MPDSLRPVQSLDQFRRRLNGLSSRGLSCRVYTRETILAPLGWMAKPLKQLQQTLDQTALSYMFYIFQPTGFWPGVPSPDVW